jgi:molybdopterin converting factor subunit 1
MTNSTKNTIQITVQYFAVLREKAGTSQEHLETSAATPKALYEELQKQYGFTLGTDRLRVVVNEEFVAWDAPLHAGDTVVFIPPVAGG